MLKQFSFPNVSPEITSLWQAYISHINTDGDYDFEVLAEFVVKVWSCGYTLNVDDIQLLMETSRISELNQDSIADQVDTVYATLSVLKNSYNFEVPKNDRN